MFTKLSEDQISDKIIMKGKKNTSVMGKKQRMKDLGFVRNKN